MIEGGASALSESDRHLRQDGGLAKMIEGGASAPSPRPHLSRPYTTRHPSPWFFALLLNAREYVLMK
jgi:hypothetical protein